MRTKAGMTFHSFVWGNWIVHGSFVHGGRPMGRGAFAIDGQLSVYAWRFKFSFIDTRRAT